MITQERLKQVLQYNLETGEFTRIAKTGRKGRIGAVVGSRNSAGYIVITIDGKSAYAQRLAFLYMTGACPLIVDHIDQNTSNNAWANLRPATKSLNAYNSRTPKSNSSGLKGVSWHASGRKWQAHCGPRYLGLFPTKEDAHEAYLAALAEAA